VRGRKRTECAPAAEGRSPHPHRRRGSDAAQALGSFTGFGGAVKVATLFQLDRS
jgi:hypothetical protein